MDSHPFGSMSIHPLIPMIRLKSFQNLPCKIQGHSHSSRSHSRYNILSTHIPFVPFWSALPFLRYSYLKKMTLKIQGQGHGWGQSSKSQCDSNIPSTHILLVSTIPFLRYSIFKIWPWKSKVKVIAQGHKVDITPYLLISLSFHVDQPSHSWDTAISKFDIENSWVRSTFSRLTSLSFHVNWASHFWVRTFSKFERENQCHWWGRSSVTMSV